MEEPPLVYMLIGHGGEYLDEPYDKRKKLPEGVTMVGFTELATELFIAEAQWAYQPITAELKEKMQNPPTDLASKKELARELGAPDFRVWKDDAAPPKLKLLPILNFPINVGEAVAMNGATLPAELIVSAGVIPLSMDRVKNPKWRVLTKDDATMAGLEGPATCYTTVTDPSVPIRPEDILYAFYTFSMESSDDALHLPYTEIIHGKEYAEFKRTGKIPRHVFDYVFQQSIIKPPLTVNTNTAWTIDDILSEINKIRKPNQRVVLYWASCRSNLSGRSQPVLKNFIPTASRSLEAQDDTTSGIHHGQLKMDQARAAVLEAQRQRQYNTFADQDRAYRQAQAAAEAAAGAGAGGLSFLTEEEKLKIKQQEALKRRAAILAENRERQDYYMHRSKYLAQAPPDTTKGYREIASPAGLPLGWQTWADPYGVDFYYNPTTNQRSYELPAAPAPAVPAAPAAPAPAAPAAPAPLARRNVGPVQDAEEDGAASAPAPARRPPARRPARRTARRPAAPAPAPAPQKRRRNDESEDKDDSDKSGVGGRRKTYRRKNLRKTRKTKQRWTRTKHSRSR